MAAVEALAGIPAVPAAEEEATEASALPEVTEAPGTLHTSGIGIGGNWQARDLDRLRTTACKPRRENRSSQMARTARCRWGWVLSAVAKETVLVMLVAAKETVLAVLVVPPARLADACRHPYRHPCRRQVHQRQRY